MSTVCIMIEKKQMAQLPWGFVVHDLARPRRSSGVVWFCSLLCIVARVCQNLCVSNTCTNQENITIKDGGFGGGCFSPQKRGHGLQTYHALSLIMAWDIVQTTHIAARRIRAERK